jgi:hypothetical protein
MSSVIRVLGEKRAGNSNANSYRWLFGFCGDVLFIAETLVLQAS